MLAFYDENGLLPVWDLSTFETNTMTGYHAIPVLADAILKDWPGLDAERAYQAMLASANQSIREVPAYIEYGYVPQDVNGGSVTKTLEYAFDDYCIALVALKLRKKPITSNTANVRAMSIISIRRAVYACQAEKRPIYGTF